MPYKATKALEAVKSSTVITTYTTALPVAPAAGHLSIYVDLAAADAHRAVEVSARLGELINRAREENYRRPAGTTCYYRMGINETKKDIVFTTTSTTIAVGMVAIGINASVLSGNRGSLILDSCWKEIMEWTGENG